MASRGGKKEKRTRENRPELREIGRGCRGKTEKGAPVSGIVPRNSQKFLASEST